MELFRDGVAAFLEAVGIAAVLWVLFDWFMYPKRAVNVPVQVPLSGDAEELEPLLRRGGLMFVFLFCLFILLISCFIFIIELYYYNLNILCFA